MMQLEQVWFSYGEEPVLEDISLEFAGREFAAIIGPNGAGKSTLLKLAAGLITPQKGRVLLDGREIQGRNRRLLAQRLAYVPQDFQPVYQFTAYQIAAMGRFPYLSFLGREGNEDRRIIRQCMEETEVWSLRNRWLSELSGGERQRVVLASALAQQPDILLLDEPTSALDLKHQIRFYQLLQELHSARNLSVVIVTHDVNLAAGICQRMIVLKNGKLMAQGKPAEIINKELMERLYEIPLQIGRHPQSQRPLLLFDTAPETPASKQGN